MIKSITDASTAMRGGAAVVAAVAGIGAMAAMGIEGRSLQVMAIGVGLIVILNLGWMAFNRFRDKKKLQAGDEELIGAMRQQPRGISDAEMQGKLTALSVKLEQGIRRFKETGQSLTDKSLPWYILVGETGSGKSEAIRRSGIRFPNDLNEEQQGVGGTINMDWWFANEAIILDTAGRLLVEQGESQSLDELKRFLTFLRKVRPASPVNGLLLVIPVDSLIRDNTDTITKKSGLIARRLDLMRKNLGVRFPVWIMISKCDLIPGFRKFFADLASPESQNQILGWSNPASLNDDFDPHNVDKHLQVVQQRLLKRRLSLLLDPVHSEDPNGRRLDQVDELYNFPRSFMRVAPNLRLYLEAIFTRNRYSSEPLFLRGIYFTSSLEEGGELDADLARMRSRTVEEQQAEDASWHKERAVFLTDLFNNKVFREKGLVTRSGNPEGIPQRRKMVVLAAGLITTALLLGVSWFGNRQLSGGVKNKRDFWGAAEASKKNSPLLWPLVLPDDKSPTTAPAAGQVARFKYQGDNRDLLPAEHLCLTDLFDPAREELRPVAKPWIFRLSPDAVNRELVTARKSLYETNVLKPLLEAARMRLAIQTDPANGVKADDLWADGCPAAAALQEMLRIQVAGAGLAANLRTGPELKSLLNYVLDGNPGPSEDGLRNLKCGYTLLCPPEDLLAPAQVAKTAGSDAPKVVAQAMSLYRKYLASQSDSQVGPIGKVLDAKHALEDFGANEKKLLDLATTPAEPTSQAEFDDARLQWKQKFQDLETAHNKLQAALAEVARINGQQSSLVELYRTELNASRQKARERVEDLIALFDKDKTLKAATAADVQAQELAKIFDLLLALRDSMPKPLSLAELDQDKTAKEIAALYADALKSFDSKPAFAIRYALYGRIFALLTNGPQVSAALSGADLVKYVENSDLKNIGQLSGELKQLHDDLDATAADLPKRKEMQALCGNYTLDKLLAPVVRANALKGLLRDLPDDGKKMGELIAAHPSAQKLTIAAPVLPNQPLPSPWQSDPKFSPEAAGKVMVALKKLKDQLADKSQATVFDGESLKRQLIERIDKALPEYALDYRSHWKGAMPTLPGFAGWKDLHDMLGGMAPAKWKMIRGALQDAAQKRADALSKMPDPQGQPDLDAPALQAELDWLNNPASSEVMSDVAGELCKLDADAATARKTVMAMSWKDVYSKYAEPAAQCPYITGFAKAALDLIAKGSPPPAKAMERMQSLVAKFPMARNAKQDLSPTDAPDLQLLLGEWKLTDKCMTIPGPTSKAGQLEREMFNLWQALLSFKAADLAKLEPYRAVITALKLDETKNALTVTVMLPDMRDQEKWANGRRLARDAWEAGVIWLAPKKDPGPQVPWANADQKLADLDLGLNAAAGQGPQLALCKQSGQQDKFSPSFNPLWQLLHAVLDANAPLDAERKEWRVDLALPGNTILPLKIKFTDGLPAFDKWNP